MKNKTESDMKKMLIVLLLTSVSSLSADWENYCCPPAVNPVSSVEEFVNAAYDYHSAGIEKKILYLKLEQHQYTKGHNQSSLDAYRQILMLEILENVLDRVSEFAQKQRIDQEWFWDSIQTALNVKLNEYPEAKLKLEAFVRLKKSHINLNYLFINS